MKKFLLTLSFAASAFLNAEVLATVNGKKITDDDVKTLLGGADFKAIPEQVQKQILNQLIDINLIKEAALKDGVKNSPQYKKQIENLEEKALLISYQEIILENAKVSDREVEKFYKENKDKLFSRPAEVKARHILFNTQKEAEDALKTLKKLRGKELGAAFEKMAKEKSVDKASGANGGDLGYFNKAVMVPEFGDAAFKMKKNTISDAPVKTNFGYHIILKEDERPAEVYPLKDVSDKIKQTLKAEQSKKIFDDRLEQLRKNAKISYGK